LKLKAYNLKEFITTIPNYRNHKKSKNHEHQENHGADK
jgi:hypothetical protein